jgi:hypothetical protein
MRAIYKFILPVILILFSFSSCQKDNSEELKALNSFLYENYNTNAKALKYQQEEYRIKIVERPRTRIKKLDRIDEMYEQLISKMNTVIVAENVEIELLKTEYNQLVNEIEQFVKTEQGYTIDRFLSNTKNVHLDPKYHLNLMRNNLVIAMSYAFEHTNRPASIKNDIKSLKHIDTKVTQKNHRTMITLSSAIAQTTSQNRYVLVDKIIKNGSDTKVNYTILENPSFATITFDSLKRGNYLIQGKLLLNEEEKVLDLPFSNAFQVK